MFNVLFELERRKVHKRLKAALEDFISKEGVSPVNDCYELVMGDYAIGEYPSTREMRFFLEDASLFTHRLALQIKKKIVDYCPKWSIVPQYGARTFVVNSNGVRFNETGRTIPYLSMTSKFDDWIAETAAYDEETKGPLRRQFTFIPKLLPNAIKDLETSKAIVLAAFDRFVPPIWNGRPVLWLLTAGSEDHPRVSPGEEKLSHPVTKRGAIEPQYAKKYFPSTNNPPPYLLQVHEFPWEARGELRVKLSANANEEICLPPVKELIKDEQLR